MTTEPYKASKENIEKAIEILKSVKAKMNDTYANEKPTEKQQKMACTSYLKDPRRIDVYGPLFHSTILRQRMHDCLSSHDWGTLLDMFNLFLQKGDRVNRQLAWKWLMTIVLNYPGITAKDIQEFAKLCLGCRTDMEFEYIMKEILTFPSNETENPDQETVQEARSFLRACKKYKRRR